MPALAAAEVPQDDISDLERCVEHSGADEGRIDDCVRDDLKALDARLNARYGRLMHSGDDAFKAALRESQRAWIADRDTSCALASDSFRGAGPDRLSRRVACLHDLTDDRVKWLDKLK